MPTFKNSRPEVLAAAKAYRGDQGKLQGLLDLWAPRFGMEKAILRQRFFDSTYFSGFETTGFSDANLWRITTTGELWLRAGLPRGKSTPERLRQLRDLKARWRQMTTEIPYPHLTVSCTPCLNTMGFNNHLDFFGCGGVSMVFTDTAVFLRTGELLEACRKPENGWEEILGSQYEAEITAARAEEAQREAEKMAAGKAMAEMTAQNQKDGFYD